MKKRRKNWMAAFVMTLAACGPNAATVKHYLTTSSRRSVALFPFMLDNGQKDVRGGTKNAFKNELASYGFVAVERAFPPRPPQINTPPTPEEIRGYADLCKTNTVLIARVERAADRIPHRNAVFRNDRGYMEDANGRSVPVTVRTPVSPAIAERPAEFRAHFRLVDATTGETLWQNDANESVPGWALGEIVRYASQSAAVDLAEAYVNKKL